MYSLGDSDWAIIVKSLSLYHHSSQTILNTIGIGSIGVTPNY